MMTTVHIYRPNTMLIVDINNIIINGSKFQMEKQSTYNKKTLSFGPKEHSKRAMAL